MTLLLAFALSLPAAAGSSLVGSWEQDGEPFAELRADGSGRVDHDAVRWKADAKTLTLTYEDGETERVPYVLAGDRLTVDLDDERLVLKRKAAKPAGKDGKAAGKAAGKGGAAKAPSSPPEAKETDSLSTLLLSSPWCHFRYSQVSGTSHEERVVFRAGGSWDSGSRTETYSSGRHGTVSGQHDSGDGGRWKVQDGRLLLSEGAGPLEDVGLSVSRNSNGYPILTADGKEYSQCR